MYSLRKDYEQQYTNGVQVTVSSLSKGEKEELDYQLERLHNPSETAVWLEKSPNRNGVFSVIAIFEAYGTKWTRCLTPHKLYC